MFTIWILTDRTGPAGSDSAAQNALINELPAFFQAYASGDSAALNKFLATGALLTGLDGTVTFNSIAGPQEPPSGRQVANYITVIWHEWPKPFITKLAMTYGMSVVELQSGKWYVKELSASTEVVGAQ